MKIKFILFFLLLSTSVFAQDNDYKKFINRAYRNYQQKELSLALNNYKEAFKIKNDNAIDLYNAACMASLTGELKLANDYLLQSITNDYCFKEHLVQDADLAALKESPYWPNLIEQTNKKHKEFEKLCSPISTVNLMDCVPFKENGLWGIFDKKSKKVLIKPIFQDIAFPTSCLKVLTKGGLVLSISSNAEVSNFKSNTTSEMSSFFDDYDCPPSMFVRADSNITDGGFYKKDNYFYVSNEYDRPLFFEQDCPVPEIIISGPILIKGQSFIIVSKKKQKKLINKNGQSPEKFEDYYKYLSLVKEHPNEMPWFIFEKLNGDRGFISAEGEVRFLNEFSNYSSLQLKSKMGLVIVDTKDKKGVFDLRKISWLLPPVSENIQRISYSYSGSCGEFGYDRSRVGDFYFIVPKDRNTAYYLDINGQKLTPRK